LPGSASVLILKPINSARMSHVKARALARYRKGMVGHSLIDRKLDLCSEFRATPREWDRNMALVAAIADRKLSGKFTIGGNELYVR